MVYTGKILKFKIGGMFVRKELINIDITKGEALFCILTIDKCKKGYCIVEHVGKIGNKGVRKIILEDKSYKICKNKFYERVNKKKSEHYREKTLLLKELNDLFGYNSYCCSECNKCMDEELYRKIENYLKGKDLDPVLKNKVLCFECQKKHKIFDGDKK